MYIMKKIQVKVDVRGEKSQTELLKVVSKLAGVNELKVDKEKGMLTVVGSVDPVSLVKKIRKAKRHAEIVSVGPPKESDGDKDKDSEPANWAPGYYNYPPVVAVGYDSYHPGPCTIL